MDPAHTPVRLLETELCFILSGVQGASTPSSRADGTILGMH